MKEKWKQKWGYFRCIDGGYQGRETLKNYKNDWWVDAIIQDINNPLVHEVRRMRLGCSKLRNHMSKRNLRNCTKCDVDVPETNEHFFEICTMYQPQRRILKNDIDHALKVMKMKFNTGWTQELWTRKNRWKKIKDGYYWFMKTCWNLWKIQKDLHAGDFIYVVKK